MVEESKYCSHVIKKHFNKEFAMTQENNETFESSAKCWIYNTFAKNDVKVRDHCHVTGKYRGAAHRDCNINASRNNKTPIVSQFKKYDALIIQELGKFHFKINS